MTVTIVMSHDGDWEGIYVDGVLKHEGHSLDAGHVLEALGVEYEWREAVVDCRLPENLSDVK